MCYVSHSIMYNSLQPHGLQPARLLCPWGFSRQKYWSRLPFPYPGDLPKPDITPRSPTLQSDFLTVWANSSVQFSCSVMSNSLKPMDCSTPGIPVHHQLPEHIQTHVHRISDAIQPFHPLSSPSPSTFNLSQDWDLIQ